VLSGFEDYSEVLVQHFGLSLDEDEVAAIADGDGISCRRRESAVLLPVIRATSMGFLLQEGNRD
jgi:hypothetical protein